MRRATGWPRGAGSGVEAVLTTLRASSVDALRRQWLRIYHRPPPRGLKRDLLLRALCFELQASESGGLSPRLERRLRAASNVESTTRSRTLKPGTRLVRTWQGESHHVVVTERAFENHGETFESLSAVARTITGTRWSGPRFFGIKGQDTSHAQLS